MAYLLAAVATGLLGLALIFASWQRWISARLRGVATATGWLGLLVSGYFWIVSTGAEFGISLALLVPSVLAWILVLGNRQLRERRTRTEPAVQKVSLDARSWVRHVILFVLVVPLAAVSSALVSVALSMLLPWREVNAMLLVLVVMPILWGCIAYWSCADSRVVRPAAAMLAGALLGAAVIYG